MSDYMLQSTVDSTQEDDTQIVDAVENDTIEDELNMNNPPDIEEDQPLIINENENNNISNGISPNIDRHKSSSSSSNEDDDNDIEIIEQNNINNNDPTQIDNNEIDQSQHWTCSACSEPVISTLTSCHICGTDRYPVDDDNANNNNETQNDMMDATDNNDNDNDEEDDTDLELLNYDDPTNENKNEKNEKMNDDYVLIDTEKTPNTNAQLSTDDDDNNNALSDEEKLPGAVDEHDNDNDDDDDDDDDMDSNYASHKESVFSNASTVFSDATAFGNTVTRAFVACTWVPKVTSGRELTVIAGDLVTILSYEAISMNENPLSLSNRNSDTNSGVNGGDIDSIVLKTIHWTNVSGRGGKLGCVPSNILDYDANPIHNVWVRAKVSFSYNAKSRREVTVSTGERVDIRGCVTSEGMVLARRKDGQQGMIPFNFVDIPPAITNRRTSGIAKNLSSNDFRKSLSNKQSAVLVSDVNNRNSMSYSRHSSVGGYTNTGTNNVGGLSSSVLDTQMVPQASTDDMNYMDNPQAPKSKKQKITSKVKAISSTISTAIDKLHSSLQPEVIQMGSSLATPPSNNNTTTQSASASASSIAGAPNTTGGPYQWRAPLEWKRIFVLKTFNATQEEVDRVYNMYVLEKESRGRVESILNYEENNNDSNDDFVDEFNAANPTKSKYTVNDILPFTVADQLEICGDASPEGWVLARFCNDKNKKGFVPMSHLQSITTTSSHVASPSSHDNDGIDVVMSGSYTNGSVVGGGIGALLKEHDTNTRDELGINSPKVIKNSNQLITRLSQSSTAQHMSNDNNINGNQAPQILVDENGRHMSSSAPESPSIDYNPMTVTDAAPRSSNSRLPFHWPFSSYNIKKRTPKSKGIETSVLMILLIIYLLPVVVEEPVPDNRPENYHVWFVNLFGAFIPWLLIVALRMIELWSDKFNAEIHPNNVLYARFFFYILIVFNFIGLFSIFVEFGEHAEWIEKHSPILFLACIVEIIVFICCVIIICILISFVLIWTFCCRISRNRWEVRIECYCCTKKPLKTKRFVREQRTNTA